MIELNDLLTFTRVVELESITRAARSLGCPKSSVSRKVSRLEEHLGAQLLRRSTHSVSPTEQGLIFFEYSRRCIGVLRDGERAVQVQHNSPQGVLRIAVPHELDRSMLGPLLTDYLETYPDVRLVSVLADEQVDLLKGGFDLAIIAGRLPQAESSLLATKLGASEHGIYAAPGYVERNGMPQSHVDLPRFDLLAWGTVDARAHWDMTCGDDEVRVEFRPRLTCNDMMLLRQAVLSGLGIAALPDFICKRDLARGAMVEILPRWRTPGTSFYAVFPQHEVIPMRVRAFVDFLTERLRPNLSWELPVPRHSVLAESLA